MLNHTKGGSHTSDKMGTNTLDSEYYRQGYRYSSQGSKNNQKFEEEDLKSKDPDPGIFRICGKCDFDNFDNFVLKEHNWEVAHAFTDDQKDILKTVPGYKDHKETVNYNGPQGYAIMHRNYGTDIHKLIIYPNKLANHDDAINVIKNIFELGLDGICYDEKNLPKDLAEKIKKIKKSKLVKKLESN